MYNVLANEIVLQAVRDYRYARNKLRKRNKNVKLKLVLKECENFFKSKWFNVLTQIDGKELLKKLQEE